MTNYRYDISPRATELGGGWRLQLFEDGWEVGGPAFPADPNADPHAGMAWFNALAETERAKWLEQGGSARPVDAWAAYLRMEAYNDAEATARDWLASRPR